MKLLIPVGVESLLLYTVRSRGYGLLKPPVERFSNVGLEPEDLIQTLEDIVENRLWVILSRSLFSGTQVFDGNLATI